MEIESIWGCPIECGIYKGKLCGGNGICKYDWINNEPKCFCDGNYYGVACESVKLTSNSFPIIYIITCI